jgi:anti-anti-sigma regulatory factor
MTISSVGAAHAELAAALRQSGPLIVDLGEVTEADLTFVQLIEALRRSANDAGRALSLAQPAGEAVRQVLQRGGFLDDDTSERALFWLQGATNQ